MATYKEIVYMCLDELKALHDDSYYTEEHIIFLAGAMRALLLKRKYDKEKKEEVSESNYQEICLDLERTDLIPGVCGGSNFLKSTVKIPSELKGIGHTSAYPMNYLLGSHITFVPIERMPFVGYNKWLQSIIYCAKGTDDYLYLTSNNPQFLYMKNLKLNGVFEKPEKVAELQCDASNEDGDKACDIMDRDFPIEENLIPACIEMVVQELIGSRYAPQDKQNNAEDDFNKANATQQKPVNPALRTER